MSNENINGCSGLSNTPDSQSTSTMSPATQYERAEGNSISLIGNSQFEFIPYDDLQGIINQEAMKIVGHVGQRDNVFIDKGTTSATKYLESMMNFYLRKVYTDVQGKTSYGHSIADVDNLLGFDHRLINRNNIDLIIIDNIDLDRVDFFVYLDELLRFQNQTNEPFNNVQFVIAGSRYDYPATPEGFHDQKLWNELDYDETRRDKLENLHVGLHNSYYELWTLAGFTVFA